MDKHLLETLESAVAAAVGRSDLNVSPEVAAVVLRGWASAMPAVEALRKQRPKATEKEILAAGAEAALERINSLVAMVQEEKSEEESDYILVLAARRWQQDCKKDGCVGDHASMTESRAIWYDDTKCWLVELRSVQNEGLMQIYRARRDAKGRVHFEVAES